MFANVSTESFENFRRAMGIPESGELQWKHVTVTFHMAPYLNSEQHRRCVGNSPSIVFFKDEGEPFDAREVDKLGMVPQIFVVVQPHKPPGAAEITYRVGFFHSGNLKPFGPELAANHLFSCGAIADLVLTKIHNGNVMFYYSNPMNRAFLLTRQNNIDIVLQNFLNKRYH
eukprot:TRINITY_DN3391_c0_g1_i1.p1 TRINITY_DN3391_c0_g1~~TRINITY_DN3391_c0_g1_i1.p1  ORF type:complete len:179 (-),score=30.44 TRINITY_DN3391_c0_g1_i1:15-527(-)